MTAFDGVLTTVNLPPAVIGVAYEAAIAMKSIASAVTAQGIVQTGVLNGLPKGLALDSNGAAAGSFRISGTPTGGASAGNVPLSGPGAYTFQITGTDSAGGPTTVTGTLTINLYNTFQDLVNTGVGRASQDGLN